MKPAFRWKLHGDGRAPLPGQVVRPDERLTWGRTIGLGAQHVVAMFSATRVYSTAAYWCAAGFAILFGLCPKFGAIVAAIPGGVLGGITVVLYGMIGLLGAQIWLHNRVDLTNPLNLVPVAAGVIVGIGNVTLRFTDNFQLSGIALGTLITLLGYHGLRRLAPAHLREPAPSGPGGGGLVHYDDARQSPDSAS